MLYMYLISLVLNLLLSLIFFTWFDVHSFYDNNFKYCYLKKLYPTTIPQTCFNMKFKVETTF